ncbi:hypothetical protein TeGR_g6788, partial [Tetraparma gracilis]
SSSDSSSSSSSSSSDSSNKTPVPEPPAKCSEMTDQDMCDADNLCKWDEDGNDCFKGCPSDGRALEGSMRSLEDKCICPNFVYDSGDKECKKCPAGSIAISESVCSDVLTDENIQVAVNLWVTKPQIAQLVYGDITYWDTSLVTNMARLFAGKGSFNADISSWDFSKVTTMERMFYEAYAFNQPIDNWDVSKVNNMKHMFYRASTFNQPISNWDVSKVTNMRHMFYKATVFNQPISSWDVSKVTDMAYMFNLANDFSQDLSTWCVKNVSKYTNFGYGSDLTQAQLPVWGSCPA